MAARPRSRFDRDDDRPQSDVYTGLLAISLIAMIVSSILLFLDYRQYGETKAPPVPRVDPMPQRPVSQGQLPPPPPLEDRPITRANDSGSQGVALLPDPAPAPTPITPVGGIEITGPMPVIPAGGEPQGKRE
jgi:hypothetical protein